MDSNGSVWVLRGFYASIWEPIGPYISFCVFIDCNGSLKGLYNSLFVLKDFNGLLWVLISPYAFLLVLMGPYEFF